MQSQISHDKEDVRRWSRQIVNEIRTDFKIIPLNSLKSADYLLARPLMILLEKEDDHYIASLDDIEAFHVAETEYEAINGLCEEIIQLHEDLSEPGSKLGPIPRRWLIFLKDYIKTR